MTPPSLTHLARSLGRIRLAPVDGPLEDPQGKGFAVRRADGETVFVTAAHLALRFDPGGAPRVMPVREGVLCELVPGIGATLTTAPPLAAPRVLADTEDLARDVMVFGLAAVPASVACFELADADPIELAPVFVVTELRNRADRGRVHRATIVKVFEQGVLALTFEDGLTKSEIQACSGSPIVGSDGRVVGLVARATETRGLVLVSGPTVRGIRAAVEGRPLTPAQTDSSSAASLAPIG